MPDALQIYGDIEKFEESGKHLLVSGILSTPQEDNDGEIITTKAMEKALKDFLVNGSCREQHNPFIAAGKPIAAHIDEQGRTHVTVKVVDQGTIDKVKEKVLKAFSIRAKPLKKVGKYVHELILRGADLVDQAANPDCRVEIVKFDKPGDRCSDPECKHHVEGHTEKCDMCKSASKKTIKKSDDFENSMKTMLLKALGLSDSTSDEDLQKALTTRLTAPPQDPLAAVNAEITKLTATVGDLAKSAKEANEIAQQEQRKAVLMKMQREGRVVLKEGGEAYKLEELQKMDMGTLQILATNAPQLPLKAAHIFKGDNMKPRIPNGLDGKSLTGDNLVTAVWENNGYGSLEEMLARHNPN